MPECSQGKDALMKAAQDNRPNQHIIQFGKASIHFELTYSNRKRLKISVHPDQRITVDAPYGRSQEEVLAKVKHRADWIIRQLDYFERFQPLPTQRNYISGETHIYLGRQYRLKVIPDTKERVKLIRGYLQVYVKDNQDSKRIKTLAMTWFEQHGRAVIIGRFSRCFEAVQRFGVPEPANIVFRKMEKRWGSCGKSGSIVLNTELAKAPVHCIDYVITHELCHLKDPNHGRDFYNLLTICMPDWERRKERLESVVV